MLFGLTGKLYSGKTTLVSRLIKLLKADGFTCGGVLSPGSDHKIYVNIMTGIGHAYYSGTDFIDFEGRDITKESIEFGCQALKQAAKADVDILFVDEVGKLERKQIGFYSTLRIILPKRKKPVLFIIRKELVLLFEKMFGLPLTRVWEVESTANIDNLAKEISVELKNALHQYP